MAALTFSPFNFVLALIFSTVRPTAAEDDALCLKQFKASVVDINGYLSNWIFPNASSDGFICSFNGVICWSALESKVLALKFAQAGLSGSFPNALSKCLSIQNLDFSQNNFTGGIPSDLCKQMPYLTTLDLSQNGFSGPIPDELGQCTYLNALHLQHNKLEGGIPWAIGTLPRLSDLDVSYNSLSGSIPSSFTNRSSGLAFRASAFENNPQLCDPPLQSACSDGFQHSALNLEQLVGFGGALVLACITLAVCCGCRKGVAVVPSTTCRWQSGGVEIFEQHLKVTAAELRRATSHLSPSNIIGSGGSSTVYRGRLRNGRMIAVKWLECVGQLDEEIGRSDARKQFFTELEVLGKLRHRNLVRVLGYCYNLDTMAVILDYMPMGSLDALLHGDHIRSSGPVRRNLHLGWNARLNIVLGVAKGLAYLHHDYDGNRSVIHGDLKPSNVLLDEQLEAHIADFGLAKMVGTISAGISKTSSAAATARSRSTSCSYAFRWSFGYTAPECAQQGLLSPKSDVFSFGVTLLELMTGERPSSSKLKEGQNLAKWVGQALLEGGSSRVIDQTLASDFEQWHDDMTATLKLGCSCASDMAAQRPDMNVVVAILRQLSNT